MARGPDARAGASRAFGRAPREADPVALSMGLRVGDPAPVPPPLRSEADVTRGWTDGPPLVSVICPTYQHVTFIEDALRGILAQDTPFPFEVIVRDDASTDGTADIVASLRDRYPTIIRAILETENQWTAGRRAWASWNVQGRFIARCDGDDHWLDPTKLAVQVASLERRPDAVLSHHHAILVGDHGIESLHFAGYHLLRDLSAEEMRGRPRGTMVSTILYRNVALPDVRGRASITNGDDLQRALLGRHGGAVFESTLLPAVYRLHAGGGWTGLDPEERTMRKAESLYWIALHLRDQGDLVAARSMLEEATSTLSRAPGVAPRAWRKRVRRRVRASAADLLRRLTPRLHARLRASTAPTR